MRLVFPTQEAAQACADAIHEELIERDADYAKSVAHGYTANWCVPVLHRGDSVWSVSVEARCADCLPNGLTMADAVADYSTT